MATPAATLGIVKALLVSNSVSIILFALRIIVTHTFDYWFLLWNLVLGWVPVIFVWLLGKQLRRKSWKEPLPILLTLLWLGFLPNSFYLISDLIHLQNTGDISLLFDVILFVSCIWNSLVAGMLSIVWVHRAVIRALGEIIGAGLIAVVFMLTSFAIYLGRTLRWNTWDVLVNPAGILFDVSERVINPLAHPQVVVTTLTFFILLSSMYVVIWQFVRAFDRKN